MQYEEAQRVWLKAFRIGLYKSRVTVTRSFRIFESDTDAMPNSTKIVHAMNKSILSIDGIFDRRISAEGYYYPFFCLHPVK